MQQAQKKLKNAVAVVMARNQFQNLIAAGREQHAHKEIEHIVTSLPLPALVISEQEEEEEQQQRPPSLLPAQLAQLPQQPVQVHETFTHPLQRAHGMGNDHLSNLPQTTRRLLKSRQRLLKVFLEEEVIEQNVFKLEMSHLEEEVVILENNAIDLAF